MSTRGQLSIEFLLIGAAFLGVLGIMLLSLSTVFTQGQFALSVAGGQRIINDIESKSGLLFALGENSKVSLELPAISNARLLFENDSAILTLVSGSGTEKSFLRELAFSADSFQTDLSAPQKLVLQKIRGRLVVNTQPN